MGTELEDVKKLVKSGRSSSVSPTRSTASSTLPVPRKAKVETKIIKQGSQTASGQYDTTILDSALPSYTWTSSTLPSNASGTTAFAYQSSTNNMSPGSSLLNTTSPSSLSVYGFQNNLATPSGTLLTSNTVNTHSGYGVQKNISQSIGSSGVVSTGVSTSTGTTTHCLKDDMPRKYIILEKENVPSKKETEVFVLSKDSGKQFSSTSYGKGGSVSDVSLKKEAVASSYTETSPAKLSSSSY
ncbi:collagen alpha-1(XVII) chain, partial [Tachysurus ichikawai]